MSDDREQLRDRIADTLYLRWLERATAQLVASPEDHCTDLADQVMGVVSVEIDRAVAAGRRQAADAIRATADPNVPDGRMVLLEREHAARIAEGAPADTEEDTDRG